MGCGVENYLQRRRIGKFGFAGDLWDSLQGAQQPQPLVLGKAVQEAGEERGSGPCERGLILHLSMKGLTANGIIKQLP